MWGAGLTSRSDGKRLSDRPAKGVRTRQVLVKLGASCGDGAAAFAEARARDSGDAVVRVARGVDFESMSAAARGRPERSEIDVADRLPGRAG